MGEKIQGFSLERWDCGKSSSLKSVELLTSTRRPRDWRRARDESWMSWRKAIEKAKQRKMTWW